MWLHSRGKKVFCKVQTLCSPSLNFSLHYDLIIFLTHPLPADSMKHIIRVNLVGLPSESEHAFLPITAVDSKYSHSVSPRDFWDSIYPVTRRECGKLSLGHSAMSWLQRCTTQQCIRSECARNPTYSNTTLIQTNGGFGTEMVMNHTFLNREGCYTQCSVCREITGTLINRRLSRRDESRGLHVEK